MKSVVARAQSANVICVHESATPQRHTHSRLEWFGKWRNCMTTNTHLAADAVADDNEDKVTARKKQASLLPRDYELTFETNQQQESTDAILGTCE